MNKTSKNALAAGALTSCFLLAGCVNAIDETDAYCTVEKKDNKVVATVTNAHTSETMITAQNFSYKMDGTLVANKEDITSNLDSAPWRFTVNHSKETCELNDSGFMTNSAYSYPLKTLSGS